MLPNIEFRGEENPRCAVITVGSVIELVDTTGGFDLVLVARTAADKLQGIAINDRANRWAEPINAAVGASELSRDEVKGILGSACLSRIVDVFSLDELFSGAKTKKASPIRVVYRGEIPRPAVRIGAGSRLIIETPLGATSVIICSPNGRSVQAFSAAEGYLPCANAINLVRPSDRKWLSRGEVEAVLGGIELDRIVDVKSE